MTNQQKLEALITKATDGGWDGDVIYMMKWDNGGAAWRYDAIGGESWHTQTDLYTIIFNQNFAKSLFGESHTLNIAEAKAGDYKGGVGAGIKTIGWEYRLQQMVILPTISEQIDYAYQSVFGDKV